VELIGGVSSGEKALPTDGSQLDHYKKRSTDFASAIDKVVANKEQSMVPILRSPVVLHALQEGVKEQTRVMLGEHAVPETPVFEGGLVASSDGLGWSEPV
jgi:halogenation protein CepH